MELRNAVSKETLRKYLLTSSAEAIPQARPSLLSCFTNAENPKPQLQDRLSAAGEALESCSETALQSWFDPLEILLDQEAGTLAVRFPHAFFGIRFSSLFQKLFEKKARELWGKGLSITYGAGKFTPSPPVPFVQPAPESRQDALHPAVANPMPFGEEWTFDTFIGNGKHKWALSLARDITRRAVYRATHGRAPSLDDIGEAPGLLVLCGISTFIMGALTGGFFGDFLTQVVKLTTGGDFTLPALFTPLDDTLMILIGAMALGMVQIITGMAISFVRKLKNGQVMDAVWEELTWWVVFAGIGLMAAGMTSVVLYVGLAMVVLGPVLTNKGFGKITGIFGSLYNHITGYFGDILSYSRLMALMLAGSVIAQVFNTLGAIPGNIIVFLIISLAGNALNFALNLLGCYVHDLRLQCLEYFGKFYEDGGKPFKPLMADTKYVDITK